MDAPSLHVVFPPHTGNYPVNNVCLACANQGALKTKSNPQGRCGSCGKDETGKWVNG